MKRERERENNNITNNLLPQALWMNNKYTFQSGICCVFHYQTNKQTKKIKNKIVNYIYIYIYELFYNDIIRRQW